MTEADEPAAAAAAGEPSADADPDRPRPPDVTGRQAFAAVVFLCAFCLVIGFVLGRTL